LIDNSENFFGWECISLKLPSRTFDVVIKDENDRMAFIIAIEVSMEMRKRSSIGCDV
jgi:hypothetical protein